MSRIGKKLIKIPSSIKLSIYNTKIKIDGKNGSLEKSFLKYVKFTQIERDLLVERTSETKEAKSYHGLARVLISNMIKGVDSLFTKTLLAEGVGYKFQLSESFLIISAGFSHLVKIQITPEIKLKLDSATKLQISGIDKEKVGLFASRVREVRPPEPYKGKGILYEGEFVRRKAGKTGK